jgi:DNA-binding MurR/RpiR family transcriptional regulator
MDGMGGDSTPAVTQEESTPAVTQEEEHAPAVTRGVENAPTATREAASTPAPASFEELTARIHQHGSGLTPAYRALAQRVLQDPEGVAFLSVGDFAELTGVNMSTVTRFAKFLGLPGYPSLRQLCEDDLRSQTQLVHRLDSVTDPDAEVWEQAGRFDGENITRTFARMQPDEIRRAAQALSTARAVHVLGLRKSHTAAYLLWYLLQLVRDDVRLLAIDTLVEQMREVHDEDVLVAFALHRYTRQTVLACQHAHRRGVTTVALTDNAASPLVPVADHVFLVDTASPGVLRSMTAFVSLSQALAATVAAHRGAASRAALTTEEELLEHFDVYYDHHLPTAEDGPR